MDTFTTSLQIAAPPERVYEYFLRPDLLVRWMGQFARLEARPGGLFSVDINGVLIRGHYVTIEPPRLIEIAWGEAGNGEMPPGTTNLVVRLEPADGGTLVRLEHRGLTPAEAAKHAIGWPHYLTRLGTLAGGVDPGPDPFASGPERAAPSS
jgi:uncharacterized protein YndB with AHSA1/START domain